MTTSQNQKPEFIKVHCKKCSGLLFEITPTQETLFVRVKCRRCTLKRQLKTKRRLINVYVVAKISLEPPEDTALDSASENSARAA